MKTLSLAAFALIALTAVGCASKAGDDDVGTGTGEVNAAAPITLENWISHPKIVAVRTIVTDIDASNAKYTPESKELCADSGVGSVERTKLTDENGLIRELVLSFGSEDSATTESHYYDANGKLRFVFTTHNDVHGNSTELRTYFDETGARIWDVSRHAFSETFNPDLEHAPYEAIALEDRSELQAGVLTPAAAYDAPENCNP